MPPFQTDPLRAALLYKSHDQLNFKHLATTLNLILEPAQLKFRVIHERDGKTAVLSCRKLHVALFANDAALSSDDFQRTLEEQSQTSITTDLRTKVANHKRTIEISVGAGPLPHHAEAADPKTAPLLPLLAQMVVNHLLNMNPADAVYWGDTNKIMSPKAFLAMINAPTPSETHRPKAVPPRAPIAAIPPHQDLLRRDILTPRPASPQDADTDAARPRPSFLTQHLGAESLGDRFELTDHLKQRFEAAKTGPKAAFVVSIATILVAPIIGMLLLVYNFMGGARLRQTALLACLASAVTLTADLMAQNGAKATAAIPTPITAPAVAPAPQTAHL